jgi:hypothetical protein
MPSMIKYHRAYVDTGRAKVEAFFAQSEGGFV